ncbi:MAG: 50S ribosomal protein L15 [Patescibacteria group bacterium]|nr:50S ribosomal protein L15 [Patescibacteria group bacterium]
MQLHQIKPSSTQRRKKRVGRGGKRGTYSGRGMKGQKSRSGSGKEPIIRGVIKRYPKLRGYRVSSKKPDLLQVNLTILERKFEDSEIVSPKALIDKRIIRKIRGKTPGVKILANGDLTKKLTIKYCQVSEQAKTKIEKVGGKVL